MGEDLHSGCTCVRVSSCRPSTIGARCPARSIGSRVATLCSSIRDGIVAAVHSPSLALCARSGTRLRCSAASSRSKARRLHAPPPHRLYSRHWSAAARRTQCHVDHARHCRGDGGSEGNARSMARSTQFETLQRCHQHTSQDKCICLAETLIDRTSDSRGAADRPGGRSAARRAQATTRTCVREARSTIISKLVERARSSAQYAAQAATAATDADSDLLWPEGSGE